MNRREAESRPENARAFALAARLGVAEFADRLDLRGHVVVTGAVVDGLVRDVPRLVLEAAYRTRLLDVVAGVERAGPAVRPVGPRAVDASGAVGSLPRRPDSELSRSPVALLEDPEVMARVLAALESDSEPEPVLAAEWVADSWWTEAAI